MSSERNLLRVFVVDDEPIIASTFGMILNHQGFEAHSFNFPLEALSAAREEAPDLLISDVLMPVLSGIDLAIQMRELCPSCKVLLFSGPALTANLLENALASGHHFELISKPVHPAELLKKIRAVMQA